MRFDLFDSYNEDEFEEDQEITCKFCGEEGLHWDDVESEDYRLHTSQNRLHVCQPTADGFEEIEE